MHTLFIAFISFVSYATGVVTVQRWKGKGRGGPVHPVELLLGAAIAMCGVFLRKPHYSLKYLALCSIGMILVGGIVGFALLVSKEHQAAGTREFEERHGDGSNLSLWKRWLNSSRAVVDYEFRLVLLACYLIIIGPFAILYRLGRGRINREEMKSSWLPRNDDFSADAARRPF